MRRTLLPLAGIVLISLILVVSSDVSRPHAAVSSNIVYFPQVADIGGYTTSFLIVNNQDSAVSGAISFRKQDGSPLSVSTDIGSGSTLNVSLVPHGTARFTTSGSGGVGWAALETDKPVLASAIYMYKREGVLADQVGVLGTTPRNSFALYAVSRGSEKIGLAIANPSPSAAGITLRLYQNTDGKLLATKTIQLAAGSHTADFLDGTNFFGISNFEGYVDVSSTVGVVALGLALDGGQLSSLALPSDGDTGTSNFYFPQVADIAGYTTSFLIVNNQDSAATGVIYFHKQDGTPMSVSTEIGSGNVLRVSLPARGTLRFTTSGVGGVGWAVLTTDKPVLASAIFKNSAFGSLIDQVGVLGATPRKSFSLYAISQGNEKIGLAIANPNPTAADLTLRLYKKSDGALQSIKTINLAGGSQRADFLDGADYFAGSNFEGYVQVDSTVGVAALGLALNEQQLSSLALPNSSLEGAAVGKVVGKVIWAIPKAERAALLANRKALEDMGNTIASDASFVIFPDMHAGGWKISLSDQTASLDTDGNFSLNVPSGAALGQIFDPGLPQPVGTFSVSQLTSSGGTPVPILLAINFRGPCGMNSADPPTDPACAISTSAKTYPTFKEFFCQQLDGPIKLHALTSFFGSTCFYRVVDGCCPNEGIFPSSIGCWENHKGRFCQDVTPGEILVDDQDAWDYEIPLGDKVEVTVHNNGCFGETSVYKTNSTIGGSLTGPGLEGNKLKHYDPAKLAAFKPGSRFDKSTYIADRTVTYEAPKCVKDVSGIDTYKFLVVEGRFPSPRSSIVATIRVKKIGLYKFRSTGLIFNVLNGPRDGFVLYGPNIDKDPCKNFHIHGKHPCTGAPDPEPNGCGQGVVDQVQ